MIEGGDGLIPLKGGDKECKERYLAKEDRIENGGSTLWRN